MTDAEKSNICELQAVTISLALLKESLSGGRVKESHLEAIEKDFHRVGMVIQRLRAEPAVEPPTPRATIAVVSCIQHKDKFVILIDDISFKDTEPNPECGSWCGTESEANAKALAGATLAPDPPPQTEWQQLSENAFRLGRTRVAPEGDTAPLCHGKKGCVHSLTLHPAGKCLVTGCHCLYGELEGDTAPVKDAPDEWLRKNNFGDAALCLDVYNKDGNPVSLQHIMEVYANGEHSDVQDR